MMKKIKTQQEYQRLQDTNSNDYLAYLQIANAFFSIDLYAEAIQCYQKIIAINPKCAAAYNKLGGVLSQVCEFEAADKLIRIALQMDPNNAEYLQDYGIHLRNMNRNEQATVSLQRAIELNSECCTAYLNLGLAFLQSDELKQAKKNFERCLAIVLDKLNDTRPNTLSIAQRHQYYQMAGFSLLYLNRIEEAMAYYQLALTINSESEATLIDIGHCLILLSRFEEAIKYLSQAFEINPRCHRCLFKTGWLFYKMKMIKEALNYYEQSIKVNPNFYDAYYHMTDLLFELNHKELAISCGNKAVELQPYNYKSYCNLGFMLFELNRKEQALQAFTKAISIKPNLPCAINSIGTILGEKGRIQEAAQCFQKALELSPDNHQYYCNLGNVLVRMDMAKAEKCLRRSIQLQENNYSSFIGLTQLFLMKQDLQTAKFYCIHAIKLNSSQVLGIYLLATILINEYKLEEAVLYLQIAKGIDPNKAGIYYMLGYALYRLGRTEEAIKCQQKVLELDKNDVKAINELELMKKELNHNVLNCSASISLLQVNINKKNAKDLLELGKAFQHQRKQAQAIICYRQAIKINPNNVQAYLRLGVIYSRFKDFSNATAYLQKAVKQGKYLDIVYPYLAFCLLRNKRVEETIQYCQRAINQKLATSFLYIILGETYTLKQAYIEAVNCYLKANQMNPNNQESYEKLAVCYRIMNKPRQSIDAARKAIKTLTSSQSLYPNRLNLSILLLLLYRQYDQLFLHLNSSTIPKRSIETTSIISYYLHYFNLPDILEGLYLRSIQILQQHTYAKNPLFLFCLSVIFNGSNYQQLSDSLLNKLQSLQKKQAFNDNLSVKKSIIYNCIGMYQDYLPQVCSQTHIIFIQKSILYKLLDKESQFLKNVDSSVKAMSIPDNYYYRVAYRLTEKRLLSKQPIPLRKAFVSYLLMYFIRKTNSIKNIEKIVEALEIYAQICSQLQYYHRQLILQQVDQTFINLLQQTQQKFRQHFIQSCSFQQQLQNQNECDNKLGKQQNNLNKTFKKQSIRINTQQKISKMVQDNSKKAKTSLDLKVDRKIKQSAKNIGKSHHLYQFDDRSWAFSRLKCRSINDKGVSCSYFFLQQSQLFTVLQLQKHIKTLPLTAKSNSIVVDQERYQQLMMAIRLTSLRKAKSRSNALQAIYNLVCCFNIDSKINIKDHHVCLLKQLLFCQPLQRVNDIIEIIIQQTKNKKWTPHSQKEINSKAIVICSDDYYKQPSQRQQQQESGEDYEKESKFQKETLGNSMAYANGCQHSFIKWRIVRDIIRYPFQLNLQEVRFARDQNGRPFDLSSGQSYEHDQSSHKDRTQLKVSHLQYQLPNKNIQKHEDVKQQAKSLELSKVQIQSPSKSSSGLDLTISDNYSRQYSSQEGHVCKMSGQPSSYSAQFQFQIDFQLNPNKAHWSNFIEAERGSKKGADFRQLLFNNHAYLMKYLHFQRHSLQYIARHYFDSQRVQRKGKDYLSFRIKIQQGSNSFKPNTTQNNSDYIDLLLRNGKAQVLNWVVCFLRGVVELQSIGILHADLCLRNTIQIESEGRITFKIIDFDYAFKVIGEKPEQQTLSLQQTKKILRFWLSLEDFNQLITSDLFRQADIIDPVRLATIKKIWEGSITVEQKIQHLMKHLTSFMAASHQHQVLLTLQTISYHLRHPKYYRFTELSQTIQQISEQIRNIHGTSDNHITTYKDIIQKIQQQSSL